MIPKILHQIWIGKNQIPEYYYEYKQKWSKLHPEWEYKFWTDDNIKELNIGLDLICCSSMASRANVIRLYAVNKYGGVYADTDTEFIKCFNSFLTFPAFIGEQQKGVCANGIFGSVSNAPWLQYQIGMLKNYVSKPSPWGPPLATKAVNQFKGHVTILPKNYFYPYLWNEVSPKIEDMKDSYAIHRWAASWVNEKEKK